MTPFFVLVQASKPVEKALEVALDVFASFYYGNTAKHQTRVKLMLLGADKATHEKALALAKHFEIEHVTEFVDKKDAATKAYGVAEVMLEAGTGEDDSLIVEALGAGLPVLTFYTTARKDILDNSCSMVIKFKDNETNVNSLTDSLNILYFDPEARKMLQRGAFAKHALLMKKAAN